MTETVSPGRALLPEGWAQAVNIRALPRLAAVCARHHVPFAACDACASVQAMARWANGLTREELAAALIGLARNDCRWSGAEERALLFEAARRVT